MPNIGNMVSCVLIAKNEAGRIGRCLESLRWADEVVVVDDASTDSTSEICRTYGAKVVVHVSNGDFDTQRNLGTEMAEGPWILQMDADEVVPPQLACEIRQRLEDTAKEPLCTAYRIARKNHFLGRHMRHGGWAGPGGVKLFLKGKARYVGNSVHETLQVHGPVDSLANRIEHYPFTSIEQFVERQNFYTSVETQKQAGRFERDFKRYGRYAPLMRGIKIFLKIYVRKGGFLDGRHGFLFSLLYGWADFIQWAKVWELSQSSQPG